MAKTSNTRKKSTTTRAKKSSTTKKRTASKKAAKRQEQALWYEVGLIVLFAFMIFLFLCNFGLAGPIGGFFKGILFGLFGFPAYLFPAVLFSLVFFCWVNMGHSAVPRKVTACTVLYLLIGAMYEFMAGRLKSMEHYDIALLYKSSVEFTNGGGVFGGSIAYLFYSMLDTVGSVLVIFMLCIICIVLITEKSFMKLLQKTGMAVVNRARTDAVEMRAYAAERTKDRKAAYLEQKQASGKYSVPEEVSVKTDRNQKVSGINFSSVFKKLDASKEEAVHAEKKEFDTQSVMEHVENTETKDIRFVDEPAKPEVVHASIQITKETAARFLEETDELHELRPKNHYDDMSRDSGADIAPKTEEPDAAENEEAFQAEESFGEELFEKEPFEEETFAGEPFIEEPFTEEPLVYEEILEQEETETQQTASDDQKVLSVRNDAGLNETAPKPQCYQLPPVSLLHKMKAAATDERKHLEETARKLQECLHTFGVNVTITDISQGPAVTRYELWPQQGVKVSKIVNLSDDIKLNLAATDIRIEAPIPGKSAIGIEVPNKEMGAVGFRELIESEEFKNFPSKIGFAVGKDIAGKIVVADIAKMPHMLIAGSTGSGKSVCINTIIMSILYKAHPDEVKLIMIDPKVVELSAYNGIPHLLIPVVTDPKQAAGALQWGVSEMMSRYEKFAEYNVRDMKGYNAKVDDMIKKGEGGNLKKLPQIVIIVDELADLMMVAAGEVEEAICRLAQLARAAGIHLIIATQRPSVDVITGLIKANMPSRVAFAVSSGVDSRTILDMNGAEKLLGKGDMLFYPQGYSKPIRVQGSFVSDAEVGAVVDFLKNQRLGNIYQDQEEIQKQINTLKSGTGASLGGQGSRNEDRDALFADAGRFVIEKDKASIGMLQRVFKIGFNRAARIVDQLCEHGVVGEEEGTKPRKVLMSPEQFENLLEEI